MVNMFSSVSIRYHIFKPIKHSADLFEFTFGIFLFLNILLILFKYLKGPN